VRLHRAACALALATAIAIAQSAVTSAAEIGVFCSNGMKAVMQRLLPQFERSTKHRVLVTYGVSADLKRRIDAGESFDIAVLTPTLIDDAVDQGKIAGDTRIVLARSPMAIAIRTGALKTDISTIDALKRALLTSNSIAYAREGAAGVFFAGLVQRLDLEESLKSKIKLTTTGAEVSAAVGGGDADLGVLPLSEIVSVSGVEVLGTFPSDVRGYLTMVAGASSRSTQRHVVDELVRFLTSPGSQSVLEQMGMERP
jgi:molybdate transport system substrate-binding protein